ncbi:GTPase Era [Candidatus Acetothermia bacterium]|jgi:GTP-binding protein Era|nr:GTPase Era [Candidatus Acetothermia bacterium]MCI2431844.1 GTPase Era [Candidatus Acetothermia bacterium]MCI2435771.1 GTPase Era [Candidatus Acetothermia bacterium]
MGFKSGFVGLLGQANAGKSSFINALLGQKFLIVSERRQSTRHRIRCVLTLPGAQIVFVDTPGLHKPVDKLSRYLIKQAYAALSGLDVLVYMTEPWGRLHEEDQKAFEHLKSFPQPMLLLVNKIDRTDARTLEETVRAYQQAGLFREIIPVSCKQEANLGLAANKIAELLPEGPKFFPDETRTDRSQEFIVAEFIREKIFQLTHKEIPYSTVVAVTHLAEREDGLMEIFANIYVARESQKAILIGSGGRMVKEIGSLARQEIEAFLGRKIYLDLQVKVHRDWNESEAEIARMLDRA